MRRLGAWFLALAVATPALAGLVEVPVPGAGSCLLSVDVVRCSGSGPVPTRTPGPVPTPLPTNISVSCPPGSLPLDRPLETQPTLRGYYGLEAVGKRTFQFCVTTLTPSTRGGNLGAAWLDSGGQCTQLRVALVSYNGQPVANGSTAFGGTPQLTYKLLFPGFVAPPGVYYFTVEADARACPGQQGRFQVIWTP